MTARKARQKQIPKGNDSQKSKSKTKVVGEVVENAIA
jgi:hypothetical protein